MADILMKSGRFFLQLLIELIPLFFIVTFLSGLALEYISLKTLQKGLSGRKGLTGTLIAIVLGFVTPFCSCSTIPVLAGMVQAGIPMAVLTAFLFASPYPVEIAVPVLAPLFGVPFAAVFFLAGGLIALMCAILISRRGWEDQIRPVTSHVVTFDAGDGHGGLPQIKVRVSFWTKVKRAWFYTLDFAKKLLVYIVASSAIGALIYGIVPEELIIKYAGGASLLAVPVAALIGAPIYASAVAIVPIVYSLSLKGMSAGAVIAFLITATSISPPELIMLSGMFKRKFVVTFIVAMLLGAIVTGYSFNLIS